ncbi:MAG: VPLPA-CTERM sorting domain-containing protein [Gammaproteobacteria bacterium]|nr:VPLPA-CTERM sorting domain-containing protein [Gammaproteobacteria bacterium]
MYRTLALVSTFIDSYDGYGIIHVVTGSLQNGPADGFAIIDIDGDVVEFISYEGSVDAVNGGAVGMTSVDIGIAEDGDALEGESLQLIGMGSRASDFSWGTGTNSLGVANFGQTFKPGNSEVPLPASAWLFGTALASLRLAARDRQRKPA